MVQPRRGFLLEGVKPYRLFPSVRFGMACLLMFANCTGNLCFFSMSFCLTCMVNTTAEIPAPDPIDGPISIINGTAGGNVTPGCLDRISHEENGYRGTYRWTDIEQSFILAGAGWGAAATIFISGLVVDRTGARYFYIIGFFVVGVSTLITPFLAHRYESWIGPFVMRVIQGTVQVIGFPCMLILSNAWFPIPERGTLMAISLSGSSLGGLLIFVMGGFFCRSQAGWEGLLYLCGSIAILCSVVFTLVYTEDVSKARFISRAEVSYIKRSRGQGKRISSVKIPWRSILTSFPVWGYIFIAFSNFYLYYFIADYMPKFYKEVLGLAVQNSGILSAVPMFVQFVGRFMAGPISDGLERCFSQTTSIKMMTVLSGHVPTIFLIGATFFNCGSPYGAVICIALCYFFLGFIIGGFLKSASYIAPAFAGTIAGIAQELNYASNIVVPYLTAAIMPTGAPSEWHTTFYVAAAICFAGATIFLFLGSGELQPWAQLNDNDVRSSIISGRYDLYKPARVSMLPRDSVYSEIAFP